MQFHRNQKEMVMAWSDAARAAALEARRMHSAAKHSTRMQARSPGGHPYIGTVMDAAKVAKSNRVFLANQIRVSRSGKQPNRYSLMQAAAEARRRNSISKEKKYSFRTGPRSKLVDLTKLVNMQVNPMLSHFGKPLTQKQMSAPKGSIRKYSKMGGDRRYK